MTKDRATTISESTLPYADFYGEVVEIKEVGSKVKVRLVMTIECEPEELKEIDPKAFGYAAALMYLEHFAGDGENSER